MKSHVDGFGALGGHGLVDHAMCCRVVGDHLCGVLGVSQFFKENSQWDCLPGVEEQRSHFSFHGGGHNMPNNSGDGKNGAIVIVVVVCEVEVASGAAAGLRFAEVRCIGVNAKPHVRCMVDDACIGMAGAVVKKLIGCAEGFFGAFCLGAGE